MLNRLWNVFVWALTWGLLLLSVVVQVTETPSSTHQYHVHFKIVLDPTMLFEPAFLCLVCYYMYVKYMNVDNIYVPLREKWIAEWFLHNGGVIHLAMEGVAAGWGGWVEVYKSYRLIDRRFDLSWNSVFFITQLELFVWTPLCLLTYISFVRQSRHRYLLAILTSALHVVGTILFMAPPIANQCIELPPFDVPGCFPPLDMYTFIFYYLAFGINIVWIVVPMFILWWSWVQQDRLITTHCHHVKFQ